MTIAEIKEHIRQLEADVEILKGRARVIGLLEIVGWRLGISDLDGATVDLEEIDNGIADCHGSVDSIHAHVLRLQADLLRRRGNYVAALELADDAIKLAIAANDNTQFAAAYHVQGCIQLDDDRYRQAQESVRAAQSALTRHELEQQTIGLDLQILQGRAFLKARFDTTGISDLLKCLAHRQCDEWRRYEIHRYTGMAYMDGGRFREALGHYHDAERAAYARGDAVAQIVIKKDAAVALVRLHQLHEPKEMLERCLELYCGLRPCEQDALLLARIYHTLGAVYLDHNHTLQDRENAETNFNLTADALATLDPEDGRAVMLRLSLLANLGGVSFQKGDMALAACRYTEYIRQCDARGRKGDVCKGMRLLGRTMIAMGRLEEAEATLIQALALAKEGDILDEIANANRGLSDLYEARGDYKAALDYYKCHHDQEYRIRDERAKEAATLGSLRFNAGDEKRGTLQMMRDAVARDAKRKENGLRLIFDTLDPAFNRGLDVVLSGLPKKEYTVLAFMRYYRRSKSSEVAMLIDNDIQSDERIRRLQLEIRRRIREAYSRPGRSAEAPEDARSLLAWVLSL